MSDDRRGDGNGAVVAIVVVLVILVMCGGGLLVVGGLFFSVRSAAPLPAPVAVAPVPLPPAPVTNADSSGKTAQTLELTITQDGKYLLAGDEVAADKLQDTLQARVAVGESFKVEFRPGASGNEKLHEDAIQVLQKLMIEFDIKDQ